MSDCCLSNKGRVALFASVAANIFLVAFVLGNMSSSRLPAPMDQHFGRLHRPHMFAPPMMGPGDLFGPGEVRADEERMREKFTQMKELREAFAAKLQQGPVSKEEALKHFGDVDEAIKSVRMEARERAATRISQMSEDERKGLAQKLTRQVPPPFGDEKDGRGPQPPMDEK